MNFIKQLRLQTGLSQSALAHSAGTSQPTIAAYEAGLKSPTLTTLERIARSVGFDLFVTYTPKMTREDQRSLAYHRALVKVLTQNTKPSLKHAQKNLNKMIKKHPEVRQLFERWQVWLQLPLAELINKILDPGLRARDMRQVSPFAGVLSMQDRVKVLRQFKKDYVYESS